MLKTAVLKQSKHPYIYFNPKISKGSPVISGTRVRVIDIAIEIMTGLVLPLIK